MQLLKSRNALLLEEYRELVSKRLLLLAACNNLNSTELTQLRAKLAPAGVNVKMIKTSVFRKALGEKSPLSASLTGSILAWSSNREAGEVGKLISGVFAQEPRVHLLAARIEEVEWSREGGREALERLSSRSEVQQKLLQLLQNPGLALLSSLQQPPTMLNGLLTSRKEE